MKIVTFLSLISAICPPVCQGDKAVVKLQGPGAVSGSVTIVQEYDPEKRVHITGTVTGLTEGAHGFHVHQYGDIVTDGCKSTGGHFNPFGKEHGAPADSERHVGDLGNIQANANGEATIDIYDSQVTICGRNSVVGRAIVVHAGEDDLGKGGFPDSKTTGHAGGRVACGVIGVAP